MFGLTLLQDNIEIETECVVIHNFDNKQGLNTRIQET